MVRPQGKSEVFRLLYQTEDTAEADSCLGINMARYLHLIEDKVGRLKESIDKILIRENGSYKEFDGYDNGGYVLSETNLGSEYIKSALRIEGMNDPDRSGDIVLIMKDKIADDLAQRFTTGVSCKAWHGSLNSSDSYVPLIVSYPGGNKDIIEEIVNDTEGCDSNTGCEGNWKVSDIITTTINRQFNQ